MNPKEVDAERSLIRKLRQVLTNRALRYLLDRENKETRGYKFADVMTTMYMREADNSNMTPLCLLITDGARRDNTQPTMYMTRQTCEEVD